MKSEKRYLLYLVYCLIYLVFIIGLIQQFFGFDPLLNSDTFSFLVLLSTFTLLLYFIDNPDFWERLLSIRVGSFFEAQFDRAKDSVYRESQETQPEVLREEIDKIKESPQSLYDKFIILYKRIEDKIRSLAQVNNIEFSTGASTIGDLTNKNRIDETTFMIFQSFHNIRNRIVHNPVAITTSQLENAFELGERLISRLTYVYVHDVSTDKAQEFIERSEKENPRLKYFRGNSKSGKEDHVGIYYTVRSEK